MKIEHLKKEKEKRKGGKGFVGHPPPFWLWLKNDSDSFPLYLCMSPSTNHAPPSIVPSTPLLLWPPHVLHVPTKFKQFFFFFFFFSLSNQQQINTLIYKTMLGFGGYLIIYLPLPSLVFNPISHF